MAMLAEPRRKQKWSVDPRNSTWSKDESKFGQKMLEKMGWSKGKGLGAKEQGSTENIKVQLKNDTLGLGASVNHEDNWLAHQDDFNQILAQLNNCHGQTGSDSQASEEKKIFSLEEKSKTSKKRVHYMKFAKGKDLSCRSDTDLACIFGKRPKSKKQIEEPSPDSQEEKDVQNGSPPSDQDPDVSGNTVTSTLSVAEYFAKRMAQLKKFQTKEETQPVEDEVQPSEKTAKEKKRKKKMEDISEFIDEPVAKNESNSAAETQPPSKSAMKKKRKKNMEDISNVIEEPMAKNESNSDTETQRPSKSAMKKKRKKHMEDISNVIEEPMAKNESNSDKEIQRPSKSAMKKKRKKNMEDISNFIEKPVAKNESNGATKTDPPSKSAMKKKRKKNMEDISNFVGEPVAKYHKTEELGDSEKQQEDNEEELKERKKKKRKDKRRKIDTEVEGGSESMPCEEMTPEETRKERKKKKKEKISHN
ncbi:PIN2/TERF1-interacting telomerase inhibitor 1 isoform X2 [Ambystoma mexicanum]|uniref:PIN2/TERF1-interacting telomerase inhibitor 1 isoform X2 n=1 Tax=Ambystoma mexicanum TaxID=8296 RepID=UPI0037E7E9E0